MAIMTFTDLAAQYDPAIATGVNNVISNAITGNAENLRDAFTLYFVLLGGMMAFREIPWGTFVLWMLRGGVVAFLATVEGYNTMIAVPAMQTIPAWIAQTANNGTGIVAGAAQFDLLSSAVRHQKALILQGAVGIENLGYRIEVAFYNGAVQFLILVSYWVYEGSRMIMGLLVAALPFVLFMYLFEATRSVPIKIINKGVGLLILQLMLSILLQIMLAADSTHMIKIANANVTGIGLDEQLGLMEDILVFFAFGVGCLLLIPAITAYIGGGIAVTVGNAILIGGAGAVRSAAGRAGVAGSRLINRARGG